MNKQSHQPVEEFTYKSLEATIKIGLVLVLVSWCFNIAKPFINPLAWGVIIAVALYPLHLRFTGFLQGRIKLSALIITLILLFIVIGPMFFIIQMSAENIHLMMDKVQDGTFKVPAPDPKVTEWPLIGNKVYEYWSMASSNLEELVRSFTPQIKNLGTWLLSTGVATLMTTLQFILSVIICGVFMVHGEGAHELARTVLKRFSGDYGDELTELSVATIRGVARGVLGVAIIQSLLAGMGFFVADIPAAGILTVLCLLVGVVQLPTFILLLPVILYVFSEHEPLFASVFTGWMILVGLSDNVLKPILMGKGLDLPMAVVFIGAIGGMIYSGIIGLFIGAVVMALGYKLFLKWLYLT